MTIEAVLKNAEAWDDVKGGWSDREKVREARMEELGHMKRKLLWDEVSRSDASGHRIVSVKWVDTTRAPMRNRKFVADLWQGTFEAPTRTGRIYLRLHHHGS